MGTSFTEFNGKGFWTRDTLLEVWLGALVQEIDHLPTHSEWLTLVRQDWHLQAVVGFGGYVSPGLERWVINDEEKRLLIALSEQAMMTLTTYGHVIPRDVLNALTIDETISSRFNKENMGMLRLDEASPKKLTLDGDAQFIGHLPAYERM